MEFLKKNQNQLILLAANNLSIRVNCSSMVIFSEVFSDKIDLSDLSVGIKLIIVSPLIRYIQPKLNNIAIEICPLSKYRMSQLSSIIAIGLIKGVFYPKEKVCFIGGLPDSNIFDTIITMNIENEFKKFLPNAIPILPSLVLPEVAERVINIALEMSSNSYGENFSGSMFVLGNTCDLEKYTKQLTLNPFCGCGEKKRNILDPFIDETIKELSSIDGSFIIGGNGVVESAGTMLIIPSRNIPPLGGFGTRHVAACSISLAVDCLAVVTSSNTKKVILFRNGKSISIN